MSHPFVDHAVAVVIEGVAELGGRRHRTGAGGLEGSINAAMNALATSFDALGPTGTRLFGSAPSFGLGDAGAAVADEALSAVGIN